MVSTILMGTDRETTPFGYLDTPLRIIPAISIHRFSDLYPPDHERRPRQSQKPTALPPDAKPHALFLSVFLSKASFLPTFVKGTKKIIYHDIKIDVYLNGELCASTFISNRYHDDAYEMTERIIRFSGRRVQRLLEKPWVLVPSGQSPDERPRLEKQNIGSPGGAKRQWASVSRALMMEADKLGRGRNGESSVLRDYLSTLATLEMPAEVGGMQKAGGPKMGIIDVVVTAGKGHKDDANTRPLMQPTPIRLEVPKTSAPEELDDHQEKGVSRETHVHQDATPEGLVSKDAETRAQGFISQSGYPRRSQSGLVSDPMSSGNQITLTGHRAQSFEGRQLNDLDATGMHDGSSSTTINYDTPVPVAPTFNILMDPRQPKRKFQSPATNSSSDAKLPHLARSQPTSSKSSDPHLGQSRTPQGTFGRAPEVPTLAQPMPTAQKPYKGDSVPSSRLAERKPRFKWEIVLDNKLTLEEEMELIAARAAQATAKASYHDRGRDAVKPAQLNERRSRLLDTKDGEKKEKSKVVKLKPPQPKTPPQPLNPLPTITSLSLSGSQGTPLLSGDEVVTYAPGDMVRQVKDERNGWFEEVGVVMGTRFLIG